MVADDFFEHLAKLFVGLLVAYTNLSDIVGHRFGTLVYVYERPENAREIIARVHTAIGIGPGHA